MDLGSMLSQVGGAGDATQQVTAAVTELVAQHGGVDGLVTTLRNGGLGDAVDSWISTGPNRPVDPQQLGAALGPGTTQQLAQKTGLSIDQLLPILASVLPLVIDHLTPGGSLPAGGGIGSLDELGGVVGTVLGQGGLGSLGGLLGQNKG
jgi:uncharacterized protein YidB (DUF937 family)